MSEEMQVQIVGMKDASNYIVVAIVVIGVGIVGYLLLSHLQTPKSEAQH